ncbi:MAG: response regulator transcription factor [Terriglobia bacterium]
MKLGVVSPQVLFRKSLSVYLTQVGMFSNVAEFDSVSELVDRRDKFQPIVLLIHTADPAAGIESLNLLRQLFAEIRVLFLTEDPDEEFGAQALESGASGCLSMREPPQVLVEAVGKVAEGERWFPSRVTNTVLDRLIAGRRTKPMMVGNLTPREWEVLTLIAQGHSDKEVARTLCISTETAKSHVKSIYKKLQVSTRRAAAVLYFKHVRGKTDPSNKSYKGMVAFDRL